MQLNGSRSRPPIGKRKLYWNSRWCKAIAGLPRQGRIQRQTRRCLVARGGVASMSELRAWCYPSLERQRWHHWSIIRALRKLGAKRIGWGMYAFAV